MRKWALIVDVARCTGCANCVLVTKDEHVGNDFPGYAAPQPAHGHEWISLERRTRGSGSLVDTAYVPRMCNHCDNAPCITAAGDGAIQKRPDGIVIIDPVKARGRKDLVAACPYGSITWNEEAQLPQIWIFDAHLLDQGWSRPRCVQACPTEALEAVRVSDEELQQHVTTQGLEVLRPELGTKPRVFYRNLYRAYRCFVGGNVVAANGGRDTVNVESAKVELSIDGDRSRRNATTDAFGEFKIDGLEATGAPFALRIEHEKWGSARLTGVLRESINLGSIHLAYSRTA